MYLNKYLVEFRAGKMNQKGKMVHPDKRKGLVYMYQSDDTLMHFCWQDRKTGTVEDDLIIFPDDCEYKKVPQCTTGRAFVLHLKTSNRKFFVWMQEPKCDKDDDHFKRINEILTNPPTPGSSRSGGNTPGDADLQGLFGNLSQTQLMQLFSGQLPGNLLSNLGVGGRGGSGGTSRSSRTTSSTPASTITTPLTTASTTPAVTNTNTSSTTQPPATTVTSGSANSGGLSSASQRIQLHDLQSILSGLNVAVPPEESGPGGVGPSVDLSTALTSDELESILSDPVTVEQLQPLLPQLPADLTEPVVTQLKNTLSSPQFQQALSMFSAGMQSGQLGPLMQQFELSKEAVDAAIAGNLESFVAALETQKAGEKKDEKKDEDDSMHVD